MDEKDTPIIFRSKIIESLKNILNFYSREDVEQSIKDKLTYILSGMHIDIPSDISKEDIDFKIAKNKDLYDIYLNIDLLDLIYSKKSIMLSYN